MLLLLAQAGFAAALCSCSAGQHLSGAAALLPQPPPLSPEDQAAGQDLRDELLSQYPEDTHPADREQVIGVVSRLLDAAGENDGWTVTILMDGAEVNAAAARGRQLFVWTGLLQNIRDDEELSAVLGHEIGHVLADHVTDVDFGLRYSEESEFEADRIGLLLMSEAGYDPEKALTFWRRIAAMPAAPAGTGRKNGKHPQPSPTAAAAGFVSTHPTSKQRIARIEAALPRPGSAGSPLPALAQQ